MPHVKLWWDKDIIWTKELIEAKYETYIQGYKLIEDKRCPIHAFIIYYKHRPIGYLQYYNAYEFPRSAPLKHLPKQLAALDIYIGEPAYLNKGLTSQVINHLISIYLKTNYTHLFVDPEIENKLAIKAYAKAGFELYKVREELNEVWMLRAIATS